jgi:hypothetical protein
MRRPKPAVGKQRSAVRSLSVARALPKLNLPQSSASAVPARPKPRVGKPGPAGDVKGRRNG